MFRIPLAVCSCLCFLIACSMFSLRAENEAEIRTKLQAPPGMSLLYTAQAEGVQIYIKNGDKPEWILQGPRAKLKLGDWTWKHYAGPTWEAHDGSSVVLVEEYPIAKMRAPHPDQDIDWLLIGVRSQGDMLGVLSDVRYVQRIDTKGGKAPAAPPANGADRVEVPYSATYVFYGVKDAWTVRTFYWFFGQRDSERGSDDGAAGIARFRGPAGLAADSDGNVYVADSLNHTIRKIAPDGLTTTLAGMAGKEGNADGRGGAARFSKPLAVAIDAKCNVLVADSGNGTVRKISPDGTVTTLAKSLKAPQGVAVDAAGDIFVSTGFAICKITADGTTSIFAGDIETKGRFSTKVDVDGAGIRARFAGPSSLVFGADGMLYVADQVNGIRRISPDGTVMMILGKITDERHPRENRAWNARFIAINGAGMLYHTGERGEPATSISTLVPGGAMENYAGSVAGARIGKGAHARFSDITGLCLDLKGNLYVSDAKLSAIRKISPDGTVQNFAGPPCDEKTASPGWNGNSVSAMAMDRDDHLYFALNRIDGSGPEELITPGETATAAKAYGASAVYKIGADNKPQLLAGSISKHGSTDGIGADARFDTITGIAIGVDGTVYVADKGNYAIRKIDAAGHVSTLAGNVKKRGHSDGQGTAALFDSPRAIAVDNRGNVFVTECTEITGLPQQTVREITPDGTVTTLAGLEGQAGFIDARGAEARFSKPSGMIADDSGNLYVADSLNGAIRKIAPDGSVTTLCHMQTDPASAYNTAGDPAIARAQSLEKKRYSMPSAMTRTDNGDLLVLAPFPHSIGSGTIQRVTPDGRVSTFFDLFLENVNSQGREHDWRSMEHFAVNRKCNKILFTKAYSAQIKVARPKIPICATIDAESGPIHAARQLGVSGAAATIWRWEVVRRPSGSKAELSNPAIANPTFNPDIRDTYVFRLTASSEEGVSSTTIIFRAE